MHGIMLCEGIAMAVAKDEVVQLFEALADDAQQSAYEFLLFLSARNTRPYFS